jgi:hypothetical protein
MCKEKFDIWLWQSKFTKIAAQLLITKDFLIDRCSPLKDCFCFSREIFHRYDVYVLAAILGFLCRSGGSSTAEPVTYRPIVDSRLQRLSERLPLTGLVAIILTRQNLISLDECLPFDQLVLHIMIKSEHFAYYNQRETSGASFMQGESPYYISFAARHLPYDMREKFLKHLSPKYEDIFFVSKRARLKSQERDLLTQCCHRRDSSCEGFPRSKTQASASDTHQILNKIIMSPWNGHYSSWWWGQGRFVTFCFEF